MAKVTNKSFKIKLDDGELSLYFKHPTYEEVTLIDMEFRRIYSVAVREGIITQAEAIKQFRNSGAWTKEDEAEISDIMLRISLSENVINDHEQKMDDRREAALKVANMRSELLQKMSTRTNLFDHTAESMAEQQKLHQFIILCTYNEEDDERMFASKEDYQNFLNANKDAGSEIYREAYFFDYELPEDISETWAEVQFLKEDIKEQENAQTKVKKKAKRKTKKKANKKG